MLSKNQLKFIRSLHQAKYRRQHGLFLAEGPKVVGELLQSGFRVRTICATTTWIGQANQKFPNNPEILSVTQKELERISTLQSPQEVVALVEMKEATAMQLPADDELVLVLDGIRDPGNLGTIIRTADWFGIPAVICSPDCVDVYNPKVVQASMGSIARVEVTYRQLEEVLKSKPGKVNVYGAVLDGNNLYEQKIEKGGYLVIGSESHGISPATRPFVTHPLRIPAYNKTTGVAAESLNASMAAAIFCAEFRRRSK
jgi:TrmH family RNA methyltransferase